jgi:Tetracyclin repressor-like, C-terminal domain
MLPSVIVERAQQEGALSQRLDSADVIATVWGPLYYRPWFSREALDERFVKSVVKRAIECA